MITFANGTSYETVAIYGAPMEYQSAKRDTLDIVIPADKITLDEAKNIWKDTTATSELTIIYTDEDAQDKAAVYLNYTLPVELKLTTLNDQEVVRMKLAQKSVLEITQEKQAQDIDDANAALIELASMV